MTNKWMRIPDRSQYTTYTTKKRTQPLKYAEHYPAGFKFGQLTVLTGEKLLDKHRIICLECVCDCGTHSFSSIRNLVIGVSNRCWRCGLKNCHKKKEKEKEKDDDTGPDPIKLW